VLTRLSSHRSEYLLIADRSHLEDVVELVRTLRVDPDTGEKRDVDVVNEEEEWEHLIKDYVQHTSG
jgi:RNA-splicing ligase RtcB